MNDLLVKQQTQLFRGSEIVGDREAGDEALRQALALMESALGLLDGAAAPAEIGAHLDLAICQLRNRLVGSKLRSPRVRQ